MDFSGKGVLLPQNQTKIQIPVNRELLALTGSYDEAIVLNQMIFADKELSVYDIRNLSLYTKTLHSLRKVLKSLSDKGFITMRNKVLYGICYYKVNKEIYPQSNEIVTLIEEPDWIISNSHGF